MSRYIVRAGGWTDDDWDMGEPMREKPTVDGPKQVDTGLLTASGEPIYRIPPPVGFGRDREW